MLVLGNRVGVTEYTINSDGCWVMLDQATKEKYCFNTESEAWSLAIGQNNVLYLGNINESDDHPKLQSEGDNTSRKQKRGFNFSCKLSETTFSFSAPKSSPLSTSSEAPSTNPFIFGESILPESPKLPKKERRDSKLTGLPKWFKGNLKR